MKYITCARCKTVLELIQYTQGYRNMYYLAQGSNEYHEVDNLHLGGIEPQVIITECKRITEVENKA